MDHGLMDKFVEFTGTPESPTSPTVVMDYFDGNTVTAYWNYAQNFAMNDNSFGSVPGPSTPGAINVVSGQTHGAVPKQITGTVEQGSVLAACAQLVNNCSPVASSLYLFCAIVR